MTALRIELAIDGGFAFIPGLARPIVLDDTQLSGNDQVEALRLCRGALASANRQPAVLSTPLPDARRYTLCIDIDGKRHELIAADPIADPAIAKLIEFVQMNRTGD